MSKPKDITGQKFGRLTALYLLHNYHKWVYIGYVIVSVVTSLMLKVRYYVLNILSHAVVCHRI